MHVLIAHEEGIMRSFRQKPLDETFPKCRVDHASSTIELIEKATNGEDYILVIAGGKITSADKFKSIKIIRDRGFRGEIWVYSPREDYRETAMTAGANNFYDNIKISDDERFKRDLSKLKD